MLKPELDKMIQSLEGKIRAKHITEGDAGRIIYSRLDVHTKERFAFWLFFDDRHRAQDLLDKQPHALWKEFLFWRTKVLEEQELKRLATKAEKAAVQAELERTGGRINKGSPELALLLKDSQDRSMEWLAFYDLGRNKCPICNLIERGIRTYNSRAETMTHMIQSHSIMLDQADPFRRIVYGISQLMVIIEKSRPLVEKNGVKMQRPTMSAATKRRRAIAFYKLQKEYGISMSWLNSVYEIGNVAIGKICYQGLMECRGCADWMTDSL